MARPARAPKPNLADLTTNSPVQMAQVIAGLVAGRSAREVAQMTGVPVGRISRWYRDDPEFAAMLAEVERSVVDQIRAEISAAAVDEVVKLLPKATEVLGEMLDADKESVRLAAAAHVLRFTGAAAKPSGARPAVETLIGAIGATAGPGTGD